MGPIPRLPEGFELVHREEIDSTNLEALRRAHAGEAGPLWVWAESQSQGRGRQGREWVSEKGNLYATLLLTIGAGPDVASQLAFVAALAIADAMPVQTRLKWPNDILLNGRKLAGILIETEALEGNLTVVIGCGINLAHFPAEARYPATSLANEGVAFSPLEAMEAVATGFANRLLQWDGGAGFGEIREDWLARAHDLGHSVTLTVGDETVTGTFTGLASTGAMIITHADGRRRVLHAGEVRSAHQPKAD